MVAQLFRRLNGHIRWHLKRVRRSLNLSQEDYFVLYLRIRNIFSRKSLLDIDGPIVSLTSYGKRIETVYLTIESIGRGNLRPSRMILWLDNEGFVTNPTPSLKRLVRRGLEIKRAMNYRSHTKYYPYVSSHQTFTHPLVTADDDVLYPKNWLQNLASAFNDNSSAINCFRARQININEGELGPFTTWAFCDSTTASFGNFLEGVSGVIYPPEYLAKLKSAGDGFIETCPKHDDVWLNVVAIRNGFKVRQIQRKSVLFPEIPGTQDNGLWVANLGEAGDLQIRRTYRQCDIDIIESEFKALLQDDSSSERTAVGSN